MHWWGLMQRFEPEIQGSMVGGDLRLEDQVLCSGNCEGLTQRRMESGERRILRRL